MIPDQERRRIIERVDSGGTDDTPFGSNLVTPTDEENISVRMRGIHEGIAESLVVTKVLAGSYDYFTNGKRDNMMETVVSSDKDSREKPEPITFSPTLGSIISEDAEGSNISTMDSNQTFPSSHPSLAEIVTQARQSSSILYNLPNSHISINDKISTWEKDPDGNNTILQGGLLSEDSKGSTPDLLFTSSWPKDLRTALTTSTTRSLCLLACRVLLFLPWCVAVGGAVVLFPTSLSTIAFSPLVNYISRPTTPIELFAYWAEYGLAHITIFAGAVFIVVWIFPNAGMILLGASLAQFCWAWHDFLPERTRALGEDERQMVYQLARSSWLTGNSLGIKKMNGKYYANDFDQDQEDFAVGPDSDLEESDWSTEE